MSDQCLISRNFLNRLKAAEAELEREQSNIKKLTAAKDEMSKDIAMIAVRYITLLISSVNILVILFIIQLFDNYCTDYCETLLLLLKICYVQLFVIIAWDIVSLAIKSHGLTDLNPCINEAI